MIDASISGLVNDFQDRSTDALGYSDPGYQAKFHDVMSNQTHSIQVDDPLSVAAPANTYFVVDNGDGTRSYSRAGTFKVQDGVLKTRDDLVVLGYPNGRTAGPLIPIRVPEGTPDGWVSIASDGTICVADPTVRSASEAIGRAGAAVPPVPAQLPADTGAAVQQRAHRHHRRQQAQAPANGTSPQTALPSSPYDSTAISAPPSSGEIPSYAQGNVPLPVNAPVAPPTNAVAASPVVSGAPLVAAFGTPDVPSSVSSIGNIAPLPASLAPAPNMPFSNGPVATSGMVVPSPVTPTSNPSVTPTAVSVGGGADVSLMPANASGVPSFAMFPNENTSPTNGAIAADTLQVNQMATAVDHAASIMPNSSLMRSTGATPYTGAAGIAAAAGGDPTTGIAIAPNGVGTLPPTKPEPAEPSSRQTVIGVPIGRLALARFSIGTTFDRHGHPSSGSPIAIAVPGEGGFANLKTNARDMSSVDHLNSILAVNNASVAVNSLLQAQQVETTIQKDATGLVK